MSRDFSIVYLEHDREEREEAWGGEILPSLPREKSLP